MRSNFQFKTGQHKKYERKLDNSDSLQSCKFWFQSKYNGDNDQDMLRGLKLLSVEEQTCENKMESLGEQKEIAIQKLNV